VPALASESVRLDLEPVHAQVAALPTSARLDERPNRILRPPK